MEPQDIAVHRRNVFEDLCDWVQTLICPIILGILVFVFICRVVSVDGNSMFPTLHNGDRILIWDLLYTPKDGDVVVLQTNSYGQEPLVKRVIAIAGQTVEFDFENGIVYVDGIALVEPYIAEMTHNALDINGSVTVPEGCIFVMGDNRNHSTDSRDNRIGMVNVQCVLGRALVILIPASDPDGSRQWARFGKIA